MLSQVSINSHRRLQRSLIGGKILLYSMLRNYCESVISLGEQKNLFLFIFPLPAFEKIQN